jgi:hypothetical protein
MSIYGLNQVQLVLIPILAIALAVFGILYNRAYARADSDETIEGWTWLWVVGGCATILAAITLVFGIEVGLVSLLFFGCAGTPMALGEKARLDARARAARREIRGVIDEG